MSWHSGKTFAKTEDGIWRPQNEEHALASELVYRDVWLDYQNAPWRMVSEVSSFDLSKKADAPTSISTFRGIRAHLADERYRFELLRDGAVNPGPAFITLTIRSSEPVRSEHQVWHFEQQIDPVSEKPEDDVSEEGELFASVELTPDALEMLVDDLRQPGATLGVRLAIQMLKARIAHDFDECWMGQDIVVEPGSHMEIQSFAFAVRHGPGISLLEPTPEIDGAPDNDMASPGVVQWPEELTTYDAPTASVASSAVAPATSPNRDKRLDWILVVLVLLLMVEMAR